MNIMNFLRSPKILKILLIGLISAIPTFAFPLTITKVIGGFETVAVEWQLVEGAVSYSVSFSGEGFYDEKVDNELIRRYPNNMRVDILGLKSGVYSVKITAHDINENVVDMAEAKSIEVLAHVREGFAFKDNEIPGAYNYDGTLKDDAQVIYVTAKNANTVTLDVIGERGTPINYVGLMNILNARGKGYDKTPLVIRLIGCIRQQDIDGLKSNQYIAFIGANTDKRKIENITIEGVGNDATLYGYGIFTKRSKCIEIRNLGIMLFGDDGVSMEADNSNIWVHNCDFFYGAPGSDKDQVKGDGSIDMKYNTTLITISYNHFWDTGKTTFAGGATESNPIYFTYHHNWFDHSDTRCPRLCHATTHIYNNYFDANPTMCLLSTENTSAFIENNYYRNCPSPMEINMQGLNRQRWPDGTQNGGMNKGFNNTIVGDYTLITQHDNATDFDVYIVENRYDKIPETVKSLKGGNTYNNFDTADDMYLYNPDEPCDIPNIVTNTAGRIEGGDFKWTFNNDIDDADNTVNSKLKAAILSYSSSLIGVGGGESTNIVPAYNEKKYDKDSLYGIDGKVLNAKRYCPSGVYITNQGNKYLRNK